MKFENTEVWGFEHALRGMRNAMESWDKSDSGFCGGDNHIGCLHCLTGGDEIHNEEMIKTDLKYGFGIKPCGKKDFDGSYQIGHEDLKLAQTLIKAGTADSKYLRMIHVAVDVDMPRYWWSEADTYHFNTKNSCSTMHKLLNNNNPITLDSFVICDEDIDWWEYTVNKLESMRLDYKEIQRTTKDSNAMNRLLVRAKRMLPEGFEQMRTWDTNYAELRNMYFQRKHHRLQEEWVDTFCKWVESLPYAKELIMYDGK